MFFSVLFYGMWDVEGFNSYAQQNMKKKIHDYFVHVCVIVRNILCLQLVAVTVTVTLTGSSLSPVAGRSSADMEVPDTTAGPWKENRKYGTKHRDNMIMS